MSPQTYIAFVNLNLTDQMRSLNKSNLKRFIAFSNALRNADKKCGTLLNEKTLSIQHNEFTYYGLFVKQNRNKLFTH